jgi:phosphoglycolate phosphatase-like HAD superfamily hydrolase
VPQPPSVVVLDIDGVLADVRHRLHHVAAKPKNWPAFFAAAGNDPLLEPGARFAHAATRTSSIVYLTGRPEHLRDVTVDWLARHGLPSGDLLMRGDGDRRPAKLLKLERVRRLSRRCRIDLVVDDDEAVVELLRREGFPVQRADWMTTGEGAADALFDAAVLRDAQERSGRT